MTTSASPFFVEAAASGRTTNGFAGRGEHAAPVQLGVPVATDIVGEARVGHLFTPPSILAAPLWRGCGWPAAATERALR
jgi:hypothetical protein